MLRRIALLAALLFAVCVAELACPLARPFAQEQAAPAANGQPLAVRADRFPQLTGADPRQGLTLRGLLRPRIVPPLGLKMLVPDE